MDDTPRVAPDGDKAPRLHRALMRAWGGDRVSQKVFDAVTEPTGAALSERVRQYEQHGRPIERLRSNKP